MFEKGADVIMDYKRLIIEILNDASSRQLERLYYFIRAFLS